MIYVKWEKGEEFTREEVHAKTLRRKGVKKKVFDLHGILRNLVV